MRDATARYIYDDIFACVVTLPDIPQYSVPHTGVSDPSRIWHIRRKQLYTAFSATGGNQGSSTAAPWRRLTVQACVLGDVESPHSPVMFSLPRQLSRALSSFQAAERSAANKNKNPTRRGIFHLSDRCIKKNTKQNG